MTAMETALRDLSLSVQGLLARETAHINQNAATISALQAQITALQNNPTDTTPVIAALTDLQTQIDNFDTDKVAAQAVAAADSTNTPTPEAARQIARKANAPRNIPVPVVARKAVGYDPGTHGYPGTPDGEPSAAERERMTAEQLGQAEPTRPPGMSDADWSVEVQKRAAQYCTRPVGLTDAEWKAKCEADEKARLARGGKVVDWQGRPVE